MLRTGGEPVTKTERLAGVMQAPSAAKTARTTHPHQKLTAAWAETMIVGATQLRPTFRETITRKQQLARRARYARSISGFARGVRYFNHIAHRRGSRAV